MIGYTLPGRWLPSFVKDCAAGTAEGKIYAVSYIETAQSNIKRHDNY